MFVVVVTEKRRKEMGTTFTALANTQQNYAG